MALFAGETEDDDSGSRAKMHKKVMHMSNGNIFSQDMSDVDEAKNLMVAISTRVAPQVDKFNPSEYWSLLAYDLSYITAREMTNKDFVGIFASIYDQEKTRFPGATTHMPISPITPMKGWMYREAIPVEELVAGYETLPIEDSMQYLSTRTKNYNTKI